MIGTGKKADKVKILHVVLDEKFIDDAYELFEEVLPDGNDFIILEKKRPLKHIKKAPVIFCDSRVKIPQMVYKSLKDYSFVVLHSLHTNAKTLVANASPEIKFVWIGFGYDYYPLFKGSENRFLLKKTAELKKELSLTDDAPQKLSTILKNIIKSVFLSKPDNKRVIEKISYFSPVAKSEYEFVKSNIEVYKFPLHIQWNYSSLYKSFDAYSLVNGNNILVGNNASLNNNHLDAFEVLSGAGIKQRKILCPLSYSGTKNYIEKVVENGERYFGEDFEPLVNFVDKDEYFRNILTCSYVVMNHVRQQGAGNIIFMIYSGAKVFLRKDNPLYSHYKKLGLVIYTIEELEKSPDLIHSPLNESDAKSNRELLTKYSSKRVALEKTLNLINVVKAF